LEVEGGREWWVLGGDGERVESLRDSGIDRVGEESEDGKGDGEVEAWGWTWRLSKGERRHQLSIMVEEGRRFPLGTRQTSFPYEDQSTSLHAGWLLQPLCHSLQIHGRLIFTLLRGLAGGTWSPPLKATQRIYGRFHFQDLSREANQWESPRGSHFVRLGWITRLPRVLGKCGGVIEWIGES
jgi:hypothetical protein